MTAIARRLGVDQDLEAGLLTLVGGGSLLVETFLLGAALVVCGLTIVALSTSPSVRPETLPACGGVGA